MADISGEEIYKRYEALGKDHGIMKHVWQSCLELYMPEAQGIIYGDKSESEKFQPFDFAGVMSSGSLASGLFSNTISMGDQFFGFRCNNEEMNDSEEVKSFFTEAAKTTLRYLQDSNFALESYEMMTYYCSLMTGILHTEWNEQDGRLIFKSFPISSSRIAEDSHGKIRTIYREFELSALSAKERWGDDLSKKISDKCKIADEMYEPIKFLHCVYKNPDYDPKKVGSEFKMYCSYYIECEDKEIIEKKGYDTFPYAVPRFFKKAGTPYGRGPAFSALPALRELNALRADMLDGVELGIQPPYFVPETMELDDLDLSPGSLIPYNASMGVPHPWRSDMDLSSAAQHRTAIIEEIKQLFYVDLFRMLEEQKNMTATEVQERVAEKVQSITPVITRLYDEFFSEVIGRAFYLLVDNKIITDMPEVLQNQDFTVSYTTKLDNKIKALDTAQIINALADASQITQIANTDPIFKSIVKVPEAVKRIFENRNVDPDLLYTLEETEKIQADEAQAMAQMQAAQAAMDKVNLAPIDLQKDDGGLDQMSTIEELMPGGQ